MTRPSGTGGCYTEGDIANIEIDIAICQQDQAIAQADADQATAVAEAKQILIEAYQSELTIANENKCGGGGGEE